MELCSCQVAKKVTAASLYAGLRGILECRDTSSPAEETPRAIGATLQEAGQNIREAILFHLDGLKVDGEPVPAPSAVVEYCGFAA